MPQLLLKMLTDYCPYDDREAVMWKQIRDFVACTPDCFERTCAVGHITGSAWVVNRDLSRVVLMHHAKLDRWFQPGGHCDGERDVLAVALREAREETGLHVSPFSPYNFSSNKLAANGCNKGGVKIFDIDVHFIPARGLEPEHLHYDVRFMLLADDAVGPHSNAESRAVAWFDLDEAMRRNGEASISRMIAKTRREAARLQRAKIICGGSGAGLQVQ
jgi:8-oxo-dGTP pyrophosphatase MutT (NUDIX family)